MNDKKEKNIKEPFPPDQTPNPPQIIDPSRANEQGEGQKPLKTDPKNQASENKGTGNAKSGSKKLLGESETEIDDETTI
jgi:hypothetical protein